MKLISLLALVLVSPLNAQTAKVIALSSSDAAEAKALYAQRDEINKKIAELQQKIADKYLMEEKSGSGGFSSGGLFVCPINGCPTENAEQKRVLEENRRKYEEEEKKAHHLERKQDWLEFEFSDDFKFIVPKSTTPLVNRNGIGCWNSVVPAYYGTNVDNTSLWPRNN